jgi:TyrR family helix-turn-helix protein
MQAKLLTFLQEHFFYRIGGLEMVKVDVRVNAATNVNLSDKVKKKEFREDLYYRLNVVQLSIPPLRERPDDILPLANEFIDDFNKKYGQKKSLSFDAQYWLLSYHWPGNVRELRSCIERLVILTDDQVIGVGDLQQELALDLSDSFKTETQMHTPLADAQRLVEYRMLKQAAIQYDSSRKIAKALGISHTSVNKKLALYGIKL